MPFEFPHDTDRAERLDHEFKDKVQENPWSEIVQTINHGYGTTGAALGAWSWGSGGWQTAATSWSVANAASGVDLDQISPIISPSRELFLGTVGKCIVEFEVIGKDVDVEIAIYKEDGSSLAAIKVFCGSTTEDQRGYLKLDSGSYRLAFRARTSASKGYIYQISARELPLENLAFDYGDSTGVNGGFWIGQYADGDTVSRWDNESYLAGDFTADGSEPDMSRDALATGVHSVTFDVTASEWMESESTFDLDDSAGFIIGCAMKPTGTETYMTGLTKLRGSQYTTYVGIRRGGGGGYHFRTKTYTSSTSYTLEHSIGPSPGWVDALLWWDGSTLRLFVDGEMVNSTATSGTLLTSSGTALLGSLSTTPSYEFDGDLTMPVLIDGSFTRREVDRFAQFRRALHGIY
jgi:hypothetical protein